jgi:hypothetical protein
MERALDNKKLLALGTISYHVMARNGTMSYQRHYKSYLPTMLTKNLSVSLSKGAIP